MEWQGKNGKVFYLNSGDWVENCTALEFVNGEWTLYKHVAKPKLVLEDDPEDVFGENIAEEFQPVLDLVRSIV